MFGLLVYFLFRHGCVWICTVFMRFVKQQLQVQGGGCDNFVCWDPWCAVILVRDSVR